MTDPNPTWNVILYTETRTLVGPFTTIGAAREAERKLDGYGDTEIRRVCATDAVLQALDATPFRADDGGKEAKDVYGWPPRGTA